MSVSKPEAIFMIFKITGFCLMLALWLRESETAGFFLLLSLILMSLLRWRFPNLGATILLDCALCVLLSIMWGYAQYAVILVLFEGMYRRFYLVGLAGTFSFYFEDTFDFSFPLMLALGALCGVFLGQWKQELEQKRILRDEEARKYYKLENLQHDLMSTLPQIERTTVIAERARIARDLHDNAGHEIVAAYISLQTARGLLDGADIDGLELYDAALARLNSGVNKIRETAHNLQTVTSLGVENLLETCERFPLCPVHFSVYGDTAQIPMYVWNMLESCLNESLTNTARHASPSCVTVALDVTAHLVRLSIENDGAVKSKGPMGSGLRNLRKRAVAIGGTFSVDQGERFRVICVIPILEEQNENTHS